MDSLKNFYVQSFGFYLEIFYLRYMHTIVILCNEVNTFFTCFDFYKVSTVNWNYGILFRNIYLG